MTEEKFKVALLNYLQSKETHPEAPRITPLQSEINQWRAGKYNGVIQHRGEVLAFVGSRLGRYIPESYLLQQGPFTPFTAKSLSVSWLKRQPLVMQCTRNGRFAFWFVKPELEQYLPIPEWQAKS